MQQEVIKVCLVVVSTGWFNLSSKTFYLTGTCSSTRNRLRDSRKPLDGLKSRDDDSEVVPLCSAQKLLITDQVGWPVYYLHHLYAALHCVNDSEFWIREIELGLLLYMFIQRAAWSVQQTRIYPNTYCRYWWCTILSTLLPLWLGRTGMMLSSCSEKVVVTICHTRWDEPKKHSTASSYVQWDISQGSQEWVHPVDIWMTHSTEMFHRQRGAQSDGLGTSCIPTIPSSVIWGDSKFGTVQPCMKAGCPVIPWYRFLFGPMICCTMLLYVGSVEGGAGMDQWANVWGSSGRNRGEREAESASSSPRFNVPFIHL